MKKSFLLIASLLFIKAGYSQTSDLKENQPFQIEGVEFSYSISTEEVKTIDGVQYSFFNLEWSITNKGKFSKIFLLTPSNPVPHPEHDLTKKAFPGKIFIVNGQQLQSTKKSDAISAEPNMGVVVYEQGIFIKKKKPLEGFNLVSGQSLSSKIIVAVAKGQTPVVSLQAFLSPVY